MIVIYFKNDFMQLFQKMNPERLFFIARALANLQKDECKRTTGSHRPAATFPNSTEVFV